MSATKFCSQCGEKMERNRAGFFILATLCRRCKKYSRRNALTLAVFLGLAVGGGFLIGRLTTSQEKFTFVGTPIDLQATRNSLANASGSKTLNGNADGNHQKINTAEQTESVAEETLTLCGAPTKAGHPCRRKVRGGGYCYQHRDKFKAKPVTAQQTSANNQ
jgi:hypothetical protein